MYTSSILPRIVPSWNYVFQSNLIFSILKNECWQVHKKPCKLPWIEKDLQAPNISGFLLTIYLPMTLEKSNGARQKSSWLSNHFHLGYCPPLLLFWRKKFHQNWLCSEVAKNCWKTPEKGLRNQNKLGQLFSLQHMAK